MLKYPDSPLNSFVTKYFIQILTSVRMPTEAVNTSVPIWMVDSPVSVDLGICYKRTENHVQVQL